MKERMCKSVFCFDRQAKSERSFEHLGGSNFANIFMASQAHTHCSRVWGY